MAWKPPDTDKVWTPPATDKVVTDASTDDPAPQRPGLLEQLGGVATGGPMGGVPGSNLGAATGLIDLGVHAGRLAEETTGLPLSRYVPDFIKRGYETLGQEASSTPLGREGRLEGNVGPFQFMRVPQLLEALPFARTLFRSAIPGAAQPVDPEAKGEDFWGKVGLNTLLSMGIGEGLRGGMHGLNAFVQRVAKGLEDRASALTHNQTMAAREAQHQRAGQAVEQSAAARTAREAANTEATKAAVEAIPQRTTQSWWQETLAPLGMADQAPKTLDRETSRFVQDKIGGVLNRLRGQMVFDTTPLTSNYAGTLAKLDAVEKYTAGRLDPSALSDWQRIYKELVTDKLGGRMTGSDLADYISQIGKEAQSLRQTAAHGATNGPQLYRMADGLMETINKIEESAAAPNRRVFRSMLAAAKRAYNLWSIGDEATTAGGTTPYTATPGRIATVWENRRGGSPARYASDAHPDDARLQNWLTAQQRAMGADVRPAVTGPYQGPGTVPQSFPRIAKEDIPSGAPFGPHGGRAAAHLLLHTLGVPGRGLTAPLLDPALERAAMMAARMQGVRGPGTGAASWLGPAITALPGGRLSGDDDEQR